MEIAGCYRVIQTQMYIKSWLKTICSDSTPGITIAKLIINITKLENISRIPMKWHAIIWLFFMRIDMSFCVWLDREWFCGQSNTIWIIHRIINENRKWFARRNVCHSSERVGIGEKPNAMYNVHQLNRKAKKSISNVDRCSLFEIPKTKNSRILSRNFIFLWSAYTRIILFKQDFE